MNQSTISEKPPLDTSLAKVGLARQASELAFCRHAIVSPARWAFSECQPCTRTVSGPNVLHGSQCQHPRRVLVQKRKRQVSFSLWVPFPHPAMETITTVSRPLREACLPDCGCCSVHTGAEIQMLGDLNHLVPCSFGGHTGMNRIQVPFPT